MLEKHGRRHLDKISSMYRAIHNGECENPFFASSKEQISTMWEEYSYLASFDRRINNKDGIDSLNSSERLANRPKATYRNDIVYRQPKSPTAYMQPRTATNSANNWNFDYISPPDEEALARDGFVPEWQRTERFQRDLAANTDETPPKAQIDDENGPKYIVKVDLSPHLMDRDLNSDGPLSHLWTQRKAHMENGARTEMLTISSIEHYYNDAGESSTSITNLDAPNGISDYHLSPKFRWLNIQQGTLSLRLLKDLVCNCPYIDEETLSVTVRLLRDQEEKMKIPSDNNGPDEPGTAIRYDGILKGRRWTATSVTFLTAPFMTIKHGNFNHKRRTDEYSARNMLQMLYQYDPEDKIIGFSGSTTYDALFGKKAAVYVPEMWCLLIDPNIIITMSELSLAELRGRNIHIESFEPYNSSCTVLFHCDNGITERRGITRDWTFTASSSR
ncbi:hypothetical protein F4779DRAFT_492303 [Xylariaceae sp. FL0662B]|nr:hypothetical protein F4779DRAFT_492303 [Xylariaceae sp. FL0662B]